MERDKFGQITLSDEKDVSYAARAARMVSNDDLYQRVVASGENTPFTINVLDSLDVIAGLKKITKYPFTYELHAATARGYLSEMSANGESD